MRKNVVLLLFACGYAAAGVGQANFQFTHHFTSPAAQTAIQHAGNLWGGLLVSPVPIEVEVFWIDGGGLGFLGVTIANAKRNFPNAPLPNVWYPDALAQAIAGVALDTAYPDMVIYLDSTANWYYGLDGNPPSIQLDLVETMLHEIGHGLGFFSTAHLVQGEGSYSVHIDFIASILATFPIPDLDKNPFIFDLFVEDAAGSHITDTFVYANPSVALANTYQSDQLYFNGSHTRAANSGNRARLFAPPTFIFGSSYLHLNEATYPAGTPNSLMTPFSAAGEAYAFLGSLTQGMLRDMGWQLFPTATSAVPSVAELRTFPNPVAHTAQVVVVLQQPSLTTVTVLDAWGRTVETLWQGNLPAGEHQFAWNAAAAPAGVYWCSITTPQGVTTRKMVNVKN